MAHELFRAIDDNKLERLRWLLEAGADPNGSDADYCFPPLALAYMKRGSYHHTTAVADRDTAALALLLKEGADPGRRWAPGCGGVDSTLMIGARGITPVMMAALAGDAAVVKLLVDAGVDVEAQDTKGRTAIYYARESRRPSSSEMRGCCRADRAAVQHANGAGAGMLS